jgi:hypothetical protein
MTNNYFQTQTRPNGETFISMADDCPEWVADVVRDCHDGELPNDWRYETIAALFDAIAEIEYNGEWSDDLVEIVDSLVDIYSSDLYAWATPNRWGLIADAVDDAGGYVPESGLDGMIQTGQNLAIQMMAQMIADAIRANAETADS